MNAQYETLEPETVQCGRSIQELKNWSIYGNFNESTRILEIAHLIRNSLQDALRSYIFSIRRGFDVAPLYEDVLKDGLTALAEMVGDTDRKEVENCKLCMKSATQISPAQYKAVYEMIERAARKIMFVFKYLQASGKDKYDIHPKYWLDTLPEEFYYKYTYTQGAALGYTYSIV